MKKKQDTFEAMAEKLANDMVDNILATKSQEEIKDFENWLTALEKRFNA